MDDYTDRRCFECKHFYEYATMPTRSILVQDAATGEVDRQVVNGLGACRESPPDQPKRVWGQYGLVVVQGYRTLDVAQPACSRFQERETCSKSKPSEC